MKTLNPTNKRKPIDKRNNSPFQQQHKIEGIYQQIEMQEQCKPWKCGTMAA
jgi:hypothetical protein